MATASCSSLQYQRQSMEECKSTCQMHTRQRCTFAPDTITPSRGRAGEAFKRRQSRHSLSRFIFSGGVDEVSFTNATSSPNVYSPMINLAFSGKRFGLAVNYETKSIICVDYVDRTKDFSIKA